ncbi:hypothetical protein SEA_POKYPUPPY_5 [Gordonia phage PokyPuppy]|nr:hypothetical protein SEA_POKYPUPPY_5 [Gordonia phage PokyPuppy]
MPKPSRKYRGDRKEIRVHAQRRDGGYSISVYDQCGKLLETGCFHRSNVTMTATQAASKKLGVPEGRIKISRLEYA